MDLNALSKADLLRQLSRMNERVSKLEAVLQGQAISGVKIDSITWDKAQGGTAILGGLNNVDGKLEIHDASNNQAVILDKDGVTIYSGKLTVKNQDGTTIIDSFGLSSLNNFQTNTASKAGGFGQTITSVTYVAITDATFDVVLPRAANILILADVRAQVNNISTGNVSGEGFVNIFVGGIAEDHTEIVLRGEYDSVNHDHYGEFLHSSFSTHTIKQLPAGTTTISLQGRLDNTTNSELVLYNYKFSYVILGA